MGGALALCGTTLKTLSPLVELGSFFEQSDDGPSVCPSFPHSLIGAPLPSSPNKP